MTEIAAKAKELLQKSAEDDGNRGEEIGIPVPEKKHGVGGYWN